MVEALGLSAAAGVGVGLLQISHSGSGSLRGTLKGCVRATTMVMESLSDSKLWMDVGVRAGLRWGDAVGLSFVVSDCFAVSSALREKVWRSGDFAGAVLDLCRTLGFAAAPDSGDGARVVFVDGKSESRGEGDGIRGDVALRWIL